MSSILPLPGDVHGVMSRYLAIQDIGRCMCVAKPWNAFYKIDIIWQHIAEKQEVSKQDYGLRGAILGWLYDKDYRSQVFRKIHYEENLLRSFWPDDFLQGFVHLFGNISRLRDFPCMELSPEQRRIVRNTYSHHYLPERAYFLSKLSSPITLAKVRCKYIKSYYYIFFRFKNAATQKNYKVTMEFISTSQGFLEREQIALSLRNNSKEITDDLMKFGIQTGDPASLGKLKEVIKGNSELKLY